MPSLHKSARRRTTGKDASTPPPVARARVGDLKPLGGVTEFVKIVRQAAQGDVQGRDAGDDSRSCPVVVSGPWVLVGWERVLAAKDSGTDTIEVEHCAGCDGLHPGDLLLKAAGLHYQAALERLRPDQFDARRLAAELYKDWRENRRPRRPGQAPSVKRGEWAALRKTLIKEAFGISDRALQREVRLLGIVPKLADAVRKGLVPKRHLDEVAVLPSHRQVELACRLAGGAAFASLQAEFLGATNGLKKTARGAVNAIRAGIHSIAAQARGRAGSFALRTEDYAPAREAHQYLSDWLAAPPPEGTTEDRVLAQAGDLTLAAAARGGRGVTRTQ